MSVWRKDPPARLIPHRVRFEDPQFGRSQDRKAYGRRCATCGHTAWTPIGIVAGTDAHWCTPETGDPTLIIWEAR